MLPTSAGVGPATSWSHQSDGASNWATEAGDQWGPLWLLWTQYSDLPFLPMGIGFQTKSKSKTCTCWLNGCYHSTDKGLHCTKIKKEILNCIEKYRVLRTYWTTFVCFHVEIRKLSIIFGWKSTLSGLELAEYALRVVKVQEDLCIEQYYKNVNTYLFDIMCILFHGNLLHCVFEAKERFYVETGILLKTCPAVVLRMYLHSEEKDYILGTFSVTFDEGDNFCGFL